VGLASLARQYHQPAADEHDAIGWFEKGQLGGLSFADPSYPSLLRGLLSA
jgi:hypothetical protein